MKFKTIGLFGHMRSQDIRETVSTAYRFLSAAGCEVYLEQELSLVLGPHNMKSSPLSVLAKDIDLALVIGGDGALLSAARTLLDYQVPLLGINRGSLGFLTDIKPHVIEEKLQEILDGKFHIEERFFLEAHVHEGEHISQGYGLNEIVLSAQGLHHLIQYEIYVDKHFLCGQRADGLIVATPTGSTAYALSGGGPIIHPELNALTLVPMFPHTLSMRPIVIHGDSLITLRIQHNTRTQIQLGCDSQVFLSIQDEAEIHIRKKEKKISLVHPQSYNYFKSLRSKLQWGAKLA